MDRLIKLIIGLLLIWSSACISQWSTDPSQNTPICTEPNNQFNPHIVVDEKGNSIIVWEDETDPVGYRHIYAQQISSNGNLGEVITSVSNKKLENGFQHNLLLQSYPNPFNASTQISYQLSEGGDVSLKIYNLNGQIVKSLINQKQKEGSYDITWNGKNENNNQVTSGIYLIELFSSRFKIIKKITLIR